MIFISFQTKKIDKKTMYFLSVRTKKLNEKP